MGYKLQFRRGLKKDLPVLGNGEVAYVQDTNELFIGTEEGNRVLTFDTTELLNDIDCGIFGDTNVGLPIDGGTF